MLAREAEGGALRARGGRRSRSSSPSSGDAVRGSGRRGWTGGSRSTCRSPASTGSARSRSCSTTRSSRIRRSTSPGRTGRRRSRGPRRTIACAHGVKTGLFTSPHLHTVRERLSLCGVEISEEEFAEEWEHLEPYLEVVDGRGARRGDLLRGRHGARLPVVRRQAGGARGLRGRDGRVVGCDEPHRRRCRRDRRDRARPSGARLDGPGGRHREGGHRQAGEDRGGPGAADRRAEGDRGAGRARWSATLLLEGRDWEVAARLPGGRAGSSSASKACTRPTTSSSSRCSASTSVRNVAAAIVAVESVLGHALDPDATRSAVGALRIPGRLEVMSRGAVARRLDGAHNPGGRARRSRARSPSRSPGTGCTSCSRCRRTRTSTA